MSDEKCWMEKNYEENKILEIIFRGWSKEYFMTGSQKINVTLYQYQYYREF